MPWESKFWESKKDSFKSGFNFVVYSLVKYNKVWDLIKFSTGNLPSSNLTAKFEAFFLMPRTYRLKRIWFYPISDSAHRMSSP